MHARLGWAMALGLAVGAVATAGVATNETVRYDPYFIGYQSEPAMDYGGRTLASLDAAVSRAVWGDGVWRPRIYIALFCENYVGGFLSVVQHETLGHGGRAREFGLDPSYSFGADLSGSTSIGRDPKNNLQNIVLAGAGMEADGVLAQRLLRDLYTGDGADGAVIPMLAFAKLDFTVYCLSTPNPSDKPNDFRDAYRDGNDVAYYMVSRQAQRTGGDPADVWNNRYTINFNDPRLSALYDDLQTAAAWNLADPAFLAAAYGYVVDHAIRREERVRPPVVPRGGDFGLTAGTRAFAGPDTVTRFVDLYLLTPGPLVQVYGRILDSSIDTAMGYGAAVNEIPLGKSVWLSGGVDFWQNPDSLERLENGNGWNAVGEVNTLFAGRVGVSVKVGAKSDGYFPGTPLDSGVYGGAGVLFAF